MFLVVALLLRLLRNCFEYLKHNHSPRFWLFFRLQAGNLDLVCIFLENDPSNACFLLSDRILIMKDLQKYAKALLGELFGKYKPMLSFSSH